MIQALLLLQGRPQITAAELAAELEVSVPTARRDLEALAMSGIPIYPTRGRGGGWRLIGGARTDLTGLTEGEATALLIAIAQSAGTDPERVAAIRKFVRAVPEPFRDGVQRVAAATVRDVPWGEAGDHATAATLAQLQRAIARMRQVRIEYDGSHGPSETDTVPLVVGSRGSTWYLLAGSPLDDGTADQRRVRTYRIDRIRALQTLPLRGAAPAGFDSGRAWSEMVQRVEDMRGTVRAVVRVQPWAVRALCDRFGVQARIGTPDAEGAARVEVSAHTVEALAEQLAGWTGAAEVVEPPEVRAALRMLGERITALYSADSA
ncbi:WYL domain-containing protein [Microbacterium sp. M28]|uniref:helix-turn-helix transcriptional regulator n=1 Tax=Microbacterium sp. M28 TaxID=2962064 RepID=UPI0021F4AEB8|nr:WYL domain-containing protein [Microbacterium sp. M28]UYO97836.1 WYL domain-containing protein [Microbacterium sp. M28]